MILLRTLLISLITLGCLLTASTASFAQEKVKIATVAPDGTPWAVLLNKYKKKVKKLSDKRLKPKVYLGGIKGDEQSIVRQVHKGSLQMGGVSTGALSTIAKDVEILELPYAFSSYEAADKVLDEARPLVSKILEEKGFKLIMYSENGYRSLGTKEKCIKTPADLKAVKMRSQESDVHVETYRALGASPVTISVGEVLSSLQTGVVDGFDNTPLFTQAVGWNQAVKYYTTTRHIYQPALIVANLEWYQKLPEDLQKLLIDEGLKLEWQHISQNG